MPNANPAASRQRPQCNVSLVADRSKIIFHDLSLPARRFLIPLSDSNFSIKLVSYGKHLTYFNTPFSNNFETGYRRSNLKWLIAEYS